MTATPVTLQDQNFSLFAVTDISHEKRRRVLERLFFHDVLNTAGGMLGIAEILRDASPEELDELKGIVFDLSERLVDEIKSQQVLSAAEGGDLAIMPQSIHTQNCWRRQCMSTPTTRWRTIVRCASTRQRQVCALIVSP